MGEKGRASIIGKHSNFFPHATPSLLGPSALSPSPFHRPLTSSQGCMEQRKDVNRNQCTCSPEKNKNNHVQNGTKACFKQPPFSFQKAVLKQ